MSDAKSNLHLRYLVALAFVPISDVIVAYEQVEQSPFFQINKDLVDPLMDYFLETWIGGFNRLGQRKSPLFDIAIWNCYSAVLEGLPKTNNFCEGFHYAFASLLVFVTRLFQNLLTVFLKTIQRRNSERLCLMFFDLNLQNYQF